MHVAIIGLNQSGRTTLWQFLAGEHGGKEGIATIPIFDEKLTQLARVEGSKKVSYLELTIQDTVGDIERSGHIFSDVQAASGLIITIRNFDAGFGTPSPVEDARKIKEIIIEHDLDSIQKRLQSIERELGKGRSRDEREALEEEMSALKSFANTLYEGRLIGNEELTPIQRKVAANQGLLTAKRWIPVLCCEDTCDKELKGSVSNVFGSEVIATAAKLELELCELADDEAQAFRKELGLSEESLRESVVAKIFESLRLTTFYTANQNEARAHAVPQGATAIEAAAKVHTDIAKGFICAEVAKIDDVIRAGGFAKAKTKNIVKRADKNYTVQDGDVIFFRFNV